MHLNVYIILVLTNFRPNMGFHKQLEFYEAMGFQINKESPAYRSFKLERIANHIKNGNHSSFQDYLNMLNVEYIWI